MTHLYPLQACHRQAGLAAGAGGCFNRVQALTRIPFCSFPGGGLRAFGAVHPGISFGSSSERVLRARAVEVSVRGLLPLTPKTKQKETQRCAGLLGLGEEAAREGGEWPVAVPLQVNASRACACRGHELCPRTLSGGCCNEIAFLGGSFGCTALSATGVSSDQIQALPKQ